MQQKTVSKSRLRTPGRNRPEPRLVALMALFSEWERILIFLYYVWALLRVLQRIRCDGHCIASRIFEGRLRADCGCPLRKPCRSFPSGWSRNDFVFTAGRMHNLGRILLYSAISCQPELRAGR